MTKAAARDGVALNVKDGALPTHLFRIVPLERFLAAYKVKQNSLVSPAAWPDPYEAAQLRTQIESPLFVDEEGRYSSGLRDDSQRRVGGVWRTSTQVLTRVFCQCWSDLPESDAMWRLYSTSAKGVKLRVRSKALLSSLAAAVPGGSVFLGRVDYLNPDEYQRLIQDAKTNHLIQMRPNLFEQVRGEAWAECLLRKRLAFKHESEYRLILCHAIPSRSVNGVHLYDYPLDSDVVVDEIELDPRLTDPATIERAIRGAGFHGIIRKSTLYESPELNIRPSWPESEGWSVGKDRVWKKNVEGSSE